MQDDTRRTRQSHGKAGEVTVRQGGAGSKGVVVIGREHEAGQQLDEVRGLSHLVSADVLLLAFLGGVAQSGHQFPLVTEAPVGVAEDRPDIPLLGGVLTTHAGKVEVLGLHEHGQLLQFIGSVVTAHHPVHAIVGVTRRAQFLRPHAQVRGEVLVRVLHLVAVGVDEFLALEVLITGHRGDVHSIEVPVHDQRATITLAVDVGDCEGRKQVGVMQANFFHLGAAGVGGPAGAVITLGGCSEQQEIIQAQDRGYRVQADVVGDIAHTHGVGVFAAVMELEIGIKGIGGGKVEGQAGSALFELTQPFTGRIVDLPALVAVVVGKSKPRRDGVADTAVDEAFGLPALIVADFGHDAGGKFLARLVGHPVDGAGGRVETEQVTLGTTQHFHPFHVKQQIGNCYRVRLGHFIDV